jgi:hypothetical protein
MPAPPTRQRSPPSDTHTGRRAPLVRALERIAPGENPAGVIYGLIVIGALLAAESDLHETYLDTVLSTVIAACLYWLADAYANVLGHRLGTQQRLTAAALGGALAHEWAVMRGAAIPLVTLVFCWTIGVPLHTAATAALWSTIASLIAFELLAGIRSRATPRELALDLAVGSVMGLAILALKIVLR